MKLLKYVLFVLYGCVVNTTILPFTYASSNPNTDHLLSNKQINEWREDIDYLKHGLEQRHIHLYHNISKDVFANELDKIKHELPSLSKTTLMIELMHLIKQVGDGHTQFNYWGNSYHRYPVHLQVFDEELRVVGITETYKYLLGAKLFAIEDTPTHQLIALLRPILQGVENLHSEKQRLVETINVAEVLHGLGVIKNPKQVKFTFELQNEKRHAITLNSLTPDAFHQAQIATINMLTPAGFSRHNASIDGVELFLNKDEHIAYIDFSHYPQYAAMENFANALMDTLQKESTKNVIIDLRNNDGGDFFVGLHLAWALIMVDNLNWREGMYVLIGRKTFSAAMSNAIQFRQLLNATLVGEPTGANPVGYQDADSFSLPNSGWKVQYSKRFYKFQDNADTEVKPDINMPLKWESYFACKDNQLDWILNAIQLRKK